MDRHDQVVQFLANARTDFKNNKQFLLQSRIRTVEFILNKAQREIEQNRYSLAESQIRIARKIFDL